MHLSTSLERNWWTRVGFQPLPLRARKLCLQVTLHGPKWWRLPISHRPLIVANEAVTVATPTPIQGLTARDKSGDQLFPGLGSLHAVPGQMLSGSCH